MRATLGLYFRRLVFVNSERLNEKGPLLVISNHPNAMIDPLISLYRMRAICNLLANASLFKQPLVGLFLTNMFCIPIQRPKDVPEGQPLQNDDAFQKCDEHLQKGGNLYIASEGFSFPERMVRNFKTGTARIAFNAEMKNNFALNLRILPIGINYSDSQKFDSDVLVIVGETVSADDWQGAFESNPRQTIQDFTDFIENKVRELTIDCKDADEDEFLKKLEAVAQSENHLETEAIYHRSQKLLSEIHNCQNNEGVSYANFQNQVEAYFSKLKKLKINDLNAEKYNPSIAIFQLMSGLPIFIYGFINNIIPAWLSHKMVHWLNIDKVYDTTVRFLAGLLFFPIFWTLQKNLIVHFSQGIFDFNAPLRWLYILSMIPIAVVTWWFYKEWKKYFAFYTFKKADKNGELSQLRQPIVDKIEDFLSRN